MPWTEWKSLPLAERNQIIESLDHQIRKHNTDLLKAQDRNT